MIKKKYIYNSKTLSYEPVEFSFLSVLKKTAFILFISILLAVAFSVTHAYFFDTIQEAQLKQENSNLHKQIMVLDQEVNGIQKSLAKLQEKDDKLYRSLLGVPPLEEDIRLAGIGGAVDISTPSGFLFSQSDINKAKALLEVQNSSIDELTQQALAYADKLNSQPKIFPLREKDLIRFASPFGYRTHPIYHIVKFHKGVDLTALKGTPVYATAQGKVIVATDAHDGYGKKVMIDHGNGYKTVYAHLSKINVKYGQMVNLATKIGEVGNTGTSVSSHLHYEVRKNDRPVNPNAYFYRDFTEEEFDQLVALASH